MNQGINFGGTMCLTVSIPLVPPPMAPARCRSTHFCFTVSLLQVGRRLGFGVLAKVGRILGFGVLAKVGIILGFGV